MKNKYMTTDDALIQLAKVMIQRQETEEVYWLENPLLRSMIRYELGYIEDAIADIDLAIQSTTENHFLYQYRGSYYADSQQYEKALEDFSTAIQKEPENSENYRLRGHIFRMMERYSEAIVEFTQAITLEDSLLDAYFFRGRCYAKLGESSKAKKDMKHILTNDPDHEKAAEFLRDISSN
ncbi:MAG: tetratricopeptide repeat protein [Anaerolineaceae bacterium]|nr:tetratricopeptide repeat protein [Anaerolineaceae bacterium]